MPSITKSPWKVRSSGEKNIPTTRNSGGSRIRNGVESNVNASGSGIRSDVCGAGFLTRTT
jgi:hypothetical protein